MYGPPVLGWIFVVGKLSLPRRQLSDPGRRVTLIVLFGSAVSMTVLTPAGYAAVSELAGVPNLGRLLGHAVMLLVAREVQAYLLRLNNPGGGEDVELRSRRDSVRLVAVLILLVITFSLADTPVDVPRFAGRYASAPWVLEYWIVLLSYLVPAFTNMIRLGLRHASETDKLPLRVGLRLMAFGVACALVYHVHKLFFFAASRYGIGYPAGLRGPLDMMLPFAAAVLVLIGATMPIWWLRLSVLLDWAHRYRVYQDLRPLWRDLRRAAVPMTLSERRSVLVELFDPRDIRLRLYRRVIEIRDGRITLQRYVDPEVATSARERASRGGISGQALEAEAEAATLAAALHARNHGGTTHAGTASGMIPGGTDLETDTRFLVSVARAYRRRVNS